MNMNIKTKKVDGHTLLIGTLSASFLTTELIVKRRVSEFGGDYTTTDEFTGDISLIVDRNSDGNPFCPHDMDRAVTLATKTLLKEFISIFDK